MKITLVVSLLCLSFIISEQLKCDLNSKERVDCGFVGVNRKKCEEKGCCYRRSVDGTPWCFFPGNATESENKKKEKQERPERPVRNESQRPHFNKRREWPKRNDTDRPEKRERPERNDKERPERRERPERKNEKEDKEDKEEEEKEQVAKE